MTMMLIRAPGVLAGRGTFPAVGGPDSRGVQDHVRPSRGQNVRQVKSMVSDHIDAFVHTSVGGRRADVRVAANRRRLGASST